MYSFETISVAKIMLFFKVNFENHNIDDVIAGSRDQLKINLRTCP